MDPKFQSSFIPKGPAVASTTGPATSRAVRPRGLFYLLALILFSVSVLLAVGVFGYKYYLKYRIGKMGTDLETALATLQSETISELTRLNDRIVSTESLIDKHVVLTPFFQFLETTTPKSVRFNNLQYTVSAKGIELYMRGEARGYAALALQSDIFNKSPYFHDSLFSDLNLNERGDVGFTFKTTVDPDLVSYTREVERIGAPQVAPTLPEVPTATPVSTSTSATSSPLTSPNRN